MTTQASQQQHVFPGQYFRYPGMSAPERMIPEPGPCAADTVINLAQAAQVKAPFSHFENLDIVKGYLLELDYSIDYTLGTGEVITQSPLFPWNIVANLSVSMQAAYKTMNLPGWLAYAMQTYRSFLSPKAFTQRLQGGANTFPRIGAGSEMYSNNVSPSTPNAAVTTGAAQSYRNYLEIPVSQYFDLYWEINPSNGQPIAAYPRAIVSPARMAATQRNVTPTLTFNALLGLEAYDAPATKATADTTSTASGSATASWWRSGWVPTDNPLTEPPGYGWQYARMGIDVQPSQAAAPVVNLADDRAGQGQILSIVCATWDPALNGGVGGITPAANYQSLELRKGSTVQLFNDAPETNDYRWSTQHGASLPFGGLFGWDLALTDDGRLTNENALNTLVEAGVQVVPTYSTKPSSGSTLYVGVETLQSVTN